MDYEKYVKRNTELNTFTFAIFVTLLGYICKKQNLRLEEHKEQFTSIKRIKWI